MKAASNTDYILYIIKCTLTSLMFSIIVALIISIMLCVTFSSLGNSFWLVFLISAIISIVGIIVIIYKFDLFTSKDELLVFEDNDLPVKNTNKSAELHTGPMPTWAKKSKARGWRIKKYNARDISGNIFY